MDLLVLAPTAPDLRGLRDLLGDRMEGRFRGVHIVAKAVGVGMPAAAAGSAKRIFTLRPRAALFVGTCGVYPPAVGQAPDFQPHDVIVPTGAMLLSLEVATGRAAFPEPMTTRLEPHRALTAGLTSPRTRAGLVASALASTTDDELAARARAIYGCDAEQLELFSVAHAAQLAEIPFAAALGVTHLVGSVGAEDFRRFHRASSIAAAEIVVAWVQSGAPGLPHA